MSELRTFLAISVLAVAQAACSGTSTGKLGESCTRRADCGSNLYCVNQTCVSGAPAVASLGKRGETCSAASDCESGLVCVPVDSGSGASGVGRCDFSSYNLTPTGKTCWAECKAAVDCCEIPVADQSATIKSCSDLADRIGGTPSNCETTVGAALTRECFLYKTYCDCGTSNPWTCTAGKCAYAKACTGTGSLAEVIKGCPAYTRSGIDLSTVCTNNSCGAGAASGCRTDAECETRTVADDVADTCTKGECTCIATSGLCYRKCSADLDCQQGYSCDVSQKVCVSTGECTTDAACAVLLEEVTAKCVSSKCEVPCISDFDCSYSGLQGSSAFNGKVCVTAAGATSGYCRPIGCSSDSECATTEHVKLFCDTTPATATTATVHSAITD